MRVALHGWRHAVRLAGILSLILPLVRALDAQANGGGQCGTDRTVSTLVGAGLGAAAAAIPATIIHRHDQTSSHRIVIASVSAGALVGFLAAGRDRPCATRVDSLHIADDVVTRRSGHASHDFLVGAVTGGLVGAVGSTFMAVGCESDPCHGTAGRVGVTMFFAGEGALAGGLLGALIGWARPAGQH